MNVDVVIVGCGVSGLYAALNLPKDKHILLLTKSNAEKSDSFLAQGGICVLRDNEDFKAFFDDTMKAGHYENNAESVDIMINSSRSVISDLVSFGVEFEKNGEEFIYTKEGAHSKPRILYHQDETGKEITEKLLFAARNRSNITIIEDFTVVDILAEENVCYGVVGHDKSNNFETIYADYTILATGGIGGLYEHSTNFEHLTGDALAIAIKHKLALKNINYIQIHPTTFYSKKSGRSFLISESVRGEGAILLNAKGERFVDELLPRDVVTAAIYKQMEKDNTPYVLLSFEKIPNEVITNHFPNIYAHCLGEGYNITKESIPVVPAQHYFMGGIDVDSFSKTSMNNLYAVGETACNGVHGKNRLASNSLLESLVFAKRAANQITDFFIKQDKKSFEAIDYSEYSNYKEEYKNIILKAIDEENQI